MIYVGVGVELGTGGGVGGLDIVFDEVVLLAEVHAAVEGLDILEGHLLVDGHEGVHHLAADLLAGHFVVDEQVVHHRNHHVLGDGLAGVHIGQADAVHELLSVEFLVGSVGFTNFHSIDF